MEKEFDYLRILKVDYAAYFEFWIMILPWFFYISIIYLDSTLPGIYWTFGTMAISLIGLVLMVRRICFLKYLYFQGMDSAGYIVSINHDGYRKLQSTLELEHEYQDRKYKILTDLRHSAFYKYHFRKGDNIVIRFNPKKPTEGIIRDAYFFRNNNVIHHVVPQLSESVAENKLAHMDVDFILREFVFVNRWMSDRIDTNLSLQQFVDAVLEFGFQKYSVDKQRNRVLIRNNFSLIINTSKFVDKDIFSVEFRRYYHQIYSFYSVISLIICLIIMPYLPPTRLSALVFYIFMLPIAFIWMGYELVRGIKNIKPIEYGKEAERVYSEILDAVREKEKEIAK